MIYRPYGATGIPVSVIGFGGMRFNDQKDAQGCVELVHAAYKKGINYFDTAPGYGDSEMLFGAAFKDMKKSRQETPFYVSTKTTAAEPAAIRRELERSLQRMGLDYIDFYHVWCIMSLEAFQRRKAKGALKEFEKLQQEGLIKHICISTHVSGQEVESILADYPFAGILLGYSAMNFRYREAALAAAARDQRGVVVMNPLGGGLIPQHPDRFGFIRKDENESVVEGALRFLINDSRITVALVGFSSIAQVDEAISSVDGFQPMPAERYQTIKAGIQKEFAELCTGCQYCDHCPEGIPVPRLMDAYNHYMLSGTEKALLDRLYWHWSINREDEILRRCTTCRQCEELCTQHLDICTRIETIKKIADQLGKAV
jgi:uncharacterized protein